MTETCRCANAGNKPELPTLEDADFLQQFESLSLPPVYFSHKGHLRLAWLYLKQYDTEVAVERTCSGIKAYAESLGAKDKFNLTMTDAFVRIMAQRLSAMTDKRWEVFLQQNPDLVNNAMTVLKQYYSEEHLLSEQARQTLLSPDIKPL